MPTLVLLTALLLTVGLVGCAAAAPAPDAERETARILDALNGETRSALARDYAAWRGHWVHAPYAVKTYTHVADGTSSVTLGWGAVDDFVRAYIEAHPEPEPPPAPLTEADVRAWGDQAWVTYDQDTEQGWKRESRRLERVDGAWRIAAMHTTIYGDEGPD